MVDIMKILLISNMFPSKKYPHYGVFVKNTENVLLQLPHTQVDRVVLHKQDTKLSKLLGYLWFYFSILVKGLFGRYDVIYAHFISHVALPLQIIKTLRPKLCLVLNAHGNDVVADTEQDKKFVALSHRIVPKAEHIIVPSNYYRDVMLRDYQVSPDKVFVYPSGGIDPTVFHPQPRQSVAEQFSLDPDKRYIGYISRIETDKGWDTFLHMAATLQDREELGFLVVGAGSENASFDALAEQLGIQDRLIRFPLLSQRDIAAIYSILDVFCFPTRRKSESLGLVGLESMACGCITITSDAGGPSSYMVSGENGFVFSAGSHAALTQQVCAALALSDEEKNSLRAGMVHTTTQYSKKVVDKILMDFFLALADG